VDAAPRRMGAWERGCVCCGRGRRHRSRRPRGTHARIPAAARRSAAGSRGQGAAHRLPDEGSEARAAGVRLAVRVHACAPQGREAPAVTVQGVGARRRQQLHDVRLARGGGVREGRLRVGVARVHRGAVREQYRAVGGPPEPRADVQGGGLAGESGAGRARAHVDAQLAEAGEQGGVGLLQRGDQQQAVRLAAAADERAERPIREPVQALPLL